jgi:hypothetical protein
VYLRIAAFSGGAKFVSLSQEAAHHQGTGHASGHGLVPVTHKYLSCFPSRRVGAVAACGASEPYVKELI